jgi:hypothetical protein
MTASARYLIPFVLICVLAARSVSAQQPPSLSKRANEIKAKVEKLSPQAHISVIPIQGDEEFGKFLSSDQESFTFHDIDRKTDVSLKYEEVKKVKNGYGGYNAIVGRHVDPTKNRVVIAAVVGVLVGLIVAVTVSL